MSEVIVITSGKGGVGKTTTVANIGTGLAALGKKVAVVDTDIGLRNLDVVMGLENRIVYNLVDVINGNCRLRQALIRDRRHPDLYLLPSAQTKDKTAVSPEQMIKLTEDLREEFDYVLLDCPAGIERGFRNAVAGADKALVVTTPEVSAIRDADRIIGLLESGGIRDIRLIINRLRPDMIARGDMMSVEDVLEILAVDLIGAILDDEQLVEYLKLADSLGLDALVEAHDAEEVARALKAGAQIIGVNNRDLKTFEVDVRNSIRLRELAPKDVLFVSESGIKTNEDIRKLYENEVDAVLIGETLMRSDDKKKALETLNGEALK